MGNKCGGQNNKTNIFKKPKIKQKNMYLSTMVETSQDFSKFFSSRDVTQKYSHILKQLQHKKKNQFQDINFKITPQSTKLSELHNYGRMKAVIFQPKIQQAYNFFQQNELQFSYLSCVLLFYCNNKYLLNKVFLTPNINRFDLYILQLFCFGEWCDVVIDDTLPTHKQALYFSKLIKGKQIWPLLMQKAWCKQIGSYDAAKGLSPEDCFQQITGIPAYSFQIGRRDMVDDFKSLLQQDHWIALVARSNLPDLKSKHVFYLQQIKNDIFWIRSPHNKYRFNQQSIQDSSLVKVSLFDIQSHFEFYTVGYYRPNYQPYTFKHSSNKNEQKIYQIYIQQQQPISIRYTQLYEAYFDEQSRSGYDYSPVFIQLYDSDYYLVQNCQGCHRSNQGVRSSHLSSNVFQKLRGKKFYLKIQVDWNNATQLNEGKIVAYARKNNIIIKNCEQNYNEIINKFQQRSTEKCQKQKAVEVGNNIKVFYRQKVNGLLIKIENVGKQDEQLKIDLTKCVNVRVKYRQTQSKMLTVKVKSEGKEFIQIMPMDARLHMQVKDFQVTKL